MDKCVKWRPERTKGPFHSGQTAKRMRRYPLPEEEDRGWRRKRQVNEALLTFWVSKVDYTQRPKARHPSLLTFRHSANKHRACMISLCHPALHPGEASDGNEQFAWWNNCISIDTLIIKTQFFM